MQIWCLAVYSHWSFAVLSICNCVLKLVIRRHLLAVHSGGSYADLRSGSVFAMELCSFEPLCRCLLMLVIMWCLLTMRSSEGYAGMMPGSG